MEKKLSLAQPQDRTAARRPVLTAEPHYGLHLPGDLVLAEVVDEYREREYV